MSALKKQRKNALARLFYSMMGYEVPENYDFSKARHPTEKMVWHFADVSYRFWSMAHEPAPTPKKKRRKMAEISEDIETNNQRKPTEKQKDELFEAIADNPICDDCKKPQKSTRHRTCPFASEINGIELEIFVCDNCVHERAMDI